MFKELKILSIAIAGCIALGTFSPTIPVFADDDLSFAQNSSDIDTGLGYDILTPTEEGLDGADTNTNGSLNQALTDDTAEMDSVGTGADTGSTDISSFYNEVFSACMTNAANKSDISNALSNMNSVFDGNPQISVGSYQLFDLSGTNLENNVDLSILNLQYAGLSLDLVESQVDLSGSSINAVSLFNNTYGDLASQLTLESPTIPESFSSQDMIALGQEAIDATKSSVLNSDTFQQVKSNIDISSVVSTAKNGLTNTILSSDSLKNNSELTSTLSDVSAYASNIMSKENSDNKKDITYAQKDNVNKLDNVVSSLSNYADLDNDLTNENDITMGSAYQRVTQNKYRTDMLTTAYDYMKEGAVTKEEIKQAYNNGEISKQEAVYQMASNPTFYGAQEELIDTDYININNINN